MPSRPIPFEIPAVEFLHILKKQRTVTAEVSRNGARGGWGGGEGEARLRFHGPAASEMCLRTQRKRESARER